MDSNRLRYFITVTETESIRKASEALHITPAALSKAIKLLENETGITLLNPSGRGICITAEGLELAQKARPLIENLEKIKVELKNKKNPSFIINPKPVRISSFEIFTTHFLTTLINALPINSELLLHEAIPGEIEQSLLNHKIDYGLTFLPIPTTGITHQFINNIELGIYGREEIFNKVPFSQLPFVTPVSPIAESPSEVKGLDGWPIEAIRTIKYKVYLMESALELCRQGKAVAHLPSFVIRIHNQTVDQKFHLQKLVFPSNLTPVKQAVYIVKRKADPDNDIIKRLTKAIRNECY